MYVVYCAVYHKYVPEKPLGLRCSRCPYRTVDCRQVLPWRPITRPYSYSCGAPFLVCAFSVYQSKAFALQTHNIALTRPIAQYVVAMSSNGSIDSQGSLTNVLAEDTSLRQEMEKEEQELYRAEQAIDADKVEEAMSAPTSGKLVVEEELELGRVRWDARKWNNALQRRLRLTDT